MVRFPGGVPLRTVSRARREASVYPPFSFGPHLHSGSKHLVLHVPVAHVCNYNLRWRWWWGDQGHWAWNQRNMSHLRPGV